MNRYLSRKSFVTTLGAAGFGLAAATAGRTPSTMAQESDTAPAEGMMEDFGEKRVELYNAFTAALASELNVASADEVDGAIRIAIMAVIDGEVGDGLTPGQAEALKVLVATSDVPIPAMALGAGPGMFFKGHGHGHGPGFGMGEGSFGPGRGRVRIHERYEGESRESDGPAEEGEPAEEDSSS